MPILNEPAKVINERTDHGEGYYECRFGLCIGDRVFMVGIEGYGHDQKTSNQDRAMCEAIVTRWNTAERLSEDANELSRRLKHATRVIRLLAPCLAGIGDQEREALAAAQDYLPNDCLHPFTQWDHGVLFCSECGQQINTGTKNV